MTRDHLATALGALLLAALAFSALVVAGLLSGCATSQQIADTLAPPPVSGEQYERQAEAVAIVWKAYGRRDAVPTVHLVTELTCVLIDGVTPGFMAFAPSGGTLKRCLRGVTYSGSEIYVAHVAGASPSEESFAHELLHAALARDFAFDPNHSIASLWGPGALLDSANMNLIENGL
jgi:hypothetical protein